MPTMRQLRELAERNPAPFLVEPDMESKVFSHKSVFALPAHTKVRQEEPADWERLAFLGDQVLSMCTTDVIFERYPLARSSYLTNKRSMVRSNDQVAKWSQAYGFPERIQAQPSQIQVMRANPTAQASVFEAYLGAVHSADGPQRAESWLKPLILLVLDEADEKERAEAGEEEDDSVDEQILGSSGGFWSQSNPLESRLNPMESRSNPLEAWSTPLESRPNSLESSPLEYFVGGGFSTMTLEDDDSSSQQFESFSSTPLNQNPLLRPGSSTPKARTRGAWSAPALSTQGTPSSLNKPFFHANEPARKASSETFPSALKFRNEGQSSTVAPTIVSPSLPTSSPPLSTTSRPFSPTSSTFSTASPNSSNGFLALFNQTAAQKRIDPIWTTTSIGPAHKPTFQAVVTVGNKQGVGRAHNKQAAKQIAARDALKNLKWLIERGVTPPAFFARRDGHRLRELLQSSTLLFRNCFGRLPQ